MKINKDFKKIFMIFLVSVSFFNWNVATASLPDEEPNCQATYHKIRV